MSSRIATRIALSCLLLAAPLCLPAAAQGPQMAPQTGYEIVSRGPQGVELRFHNIPLRDVHADDAQNALALDFGNPVDGALFDQLATQMPEWITLAYANYDTGVIRASQPVTFLSRQEADGFSIRLVPRAAPAQTAAAAPAPLRGPTDAPYPPAYAPAAYPPPAPILPVQGAFARYDSYGAIRNYDQIELALHRNDPVWAKAYERAAVQSDSGFSMGTEYHAYHSGDQVIASQMQGRINIGGGLALIGSLYDTDLTATKVRAPNGTFGANTGTNLLTGIGGIALETGADTQFTFEASEGNNITGGRFTAYTGDPNSWVIGDLTYHQPDLDTPESVWSRGFKDEAVLATGQHLGYGIWAAGSARFDNYGVHGNASVAKTAGWDADVRWSAEYDGLLAGIAYDGHGEYLLSHANFTGTAPTPYVPLSIRNMETHQLTATLSTLIWGDTLWLDGYGGYVADRYASNGGVYGLGVRYRPQPGVDIAMGVRHSTVSLTQGETGGETTAGVNFTLGFNSPSLGGFNFF